MSADAVKQAGPTTTTPARILIVDDDAALLQALPEAIRLRLPGVEMDTSQSGPDALERIAAVDYDTIVSDIKMPGMDGLALLNRIAELRPETPTLLITGHGEHDLAVQALRGGAYDFIQKPIDRDYFVASLRRAIQARQLRRKVEEQRQALERHAASLELEVQARTRELAEANEAKDTFLSIASHELKTPLTSLKSLAQIAHRRLVGAGAAEATLLETMQRSIDRMQLLVNDLVDVTRIDAGKLTLRQEQADLATLCRQVVEEQQATTKRPIELRLPADALPVYMDGDRISQVLANLLSNAVKFSPEDAPIVVTAEVSEGEAVVHVRDYGSGIPPEKLPHIFERFFQVTETSVQAGSKIGLGLGLFISREIVQRHGGRIWAESTLGEGSAFYIALPLAQVPAEVAEVAEAVRTARRHSRGGRTDIGAAG